jgi:hypothetical protein
MSAIKFHTHTKQQAKLRFKVLQGILGLEMEELTGGWCKATLSSFLICIFVHYCDQIKEAVMTRACSTHGKYIVHIIIILKTGMEAATWETQV